MTGVCAIQNMQKHHTISIYTVFLPCFLATGVDFVFVLGVIFIQAWVLVVNAHRAIQDGYWNNVYRERKYPQAQVIPKNYPTILQ